MPKHKGDYILTSSRDEKIVRPAALLPKKYYVGNKIIVFPKDPVAGGSWIAYAENRTACLLNGGFVKHISKPPYKKSRGLVLLDYFSFDDLESFNKHYDFKGIEPFTLVIVEQENLYELRWDEVKTTVTKLDAEQPHIWSSVTLYSEEIIAKRKIWFQSWLSLNKEYSKEAIVSFHRDGGDGDKTNDVLMNRENFLMTVSITSIEKRIDTLEMLYDDLINNSLLMI